MTSDSTPPSELPPGEVPASAAQPEQLEPGPTPAQMLNVAAGTSTSTPASGQTPAQLLGVDSGLADSLNLGEPQGRGGSLATETGKGAGSSDTPDKKG
jgi:hypothetical protein